MAEVFDSKKKNFNLEKLYPLVENAKEYKVEVELGEFFDFQPVFSKFLYRNHLISTAKKAYYSGLDYLKLSCFFHENLD